MSRLIDADDFVESLQKGMSVLEEEQSKYDGMRKAIIEMSISYIGATINSVAEMPTISAVPAVRCGECKHGVPDTNCIGEKAIRCECDDNPYGGGIWLMNPNWYCADGERKEKTDGES